jgi:hypothetical protein
MKIIKTKTENGLQVYSDSEIVALFCDETNFLTFDKFTGVLQVGLPDEVADWDIDNIQTFNTIEECKDYININNLTQLEIIETELETL